MKFPTKPIKAGTILPGTISPVFRKEFLDDMPNKAGSKVRGVDLVLINQALKAISEGTAKINGKSPATREERFIVIASYFRTAKTKLNTPFDGTVGIKHRHTVSIKYNEQIFSYSFPENN